MSQGDQSIANQAGAAFRADLNEELQALVTLSSGPTAPATTYARQYWADTTANLLKRRNAANSAWLVVDTLDEVFVVSRSSNTILGLSDYGKTFLATSTFTQTLTAAATLGDGWFVFYRNDGSGVITLDPNSTETIDGGLVLTLNPGEGCRIACNGSAFKTQGLSWNLAKRKTADESVTSSGTLQDDDHLTFPIGANEEWQIDFYLDATMGAGSIQVAINSPSGATQNVIATATATQGSNATIGGRTATVGGAIALSVGVTENFIIVSAWVLNGATAGNVALRWAQVSGNATPTTVRKGSHMRATRLA